MSLRKTILYSAVELATLQPKARQDRIARTWRAVQKYLPGVKAALNEPYFMSDLWHNMGAEALLRHSIENCELFFCELDGKLVGFASIANFTGEQGEFVGWVSPEFRSGLSRQRIVRHFLKDDILGYLIGKLQIRKLKACISVMNHPALRMVKNLGFQALAVSPADVPFQGAYHDMLLVELLNPAYFAPVETVINATETAIEPVPASINHERDERAESTIAAASPEPPTDSTTGADVSATFGTGATSGGDTAGRKRRSSSNARARSRRSKGQPSESGIA